MSTNGNLIPVVVGSRVWRDDGEARGTVRFVGPVPEIPAPRRVNVVLPTVAADETPSEQPPEAEAIWYGVEWDSACGKNDGSVKGKRYFTCKPNFGSFVTFTKLVTPRFLTDMLQQRYTEGYIPNNKIRTSGHDVFAREEISPQLGPSSPESPPASLEPISDGDELPSPLGAATSPLHCYVNVRSCDCCANLELQSVAEAAPAPKLLGTMFPNISELTMSRTLLRDWREVQIVLDELPKLTMLAVSGNPMGPVPLDGDESRGVFAVVNSDGKPRRYSNLRVLNVSSTGIDTAGMWRLLQLCPNLSEVACCFNDLAESLRPPLGVPAEAQRQVCEQLLTLRLDGNKFTNVGYIAEMFGTAERVPALTTLSVKGVPITTLLVGAASSLRGAFSRVRTLNVDETELASWEELIEALGCGSASAASETVFDFSAVEDLTIAATPMTSPFSEVERRRRLLGLLPQRLKKLNRSLISAPERLEARKGIILHFTAVRQGRAPAEPVPSCIAAQVEKEVERDAKYAANAAADSSGPTLLGPRYMVNVFNVGVVLKTFASVTEVAKARLVNFNDDLTAVFNEERSAAAGIEQLPQVEVDVRWTVSELEDVVSSALNVPLVRTEDRGAAIDGWASSNIAWGQLEAEVRATISELSDSGVSLSPADALPKIVKQVVSNNKRSAIAALEHFYGTRDTFALFHIDAELLANADACRRGFHIKNLLRGADKLHSFRFQPGDFVVCCVVRPPETN